MADPGIGTFVRYWLHYNNLASSFYKQYLGSKKIKDDYEKQIISTLLRSGMEKATIQIGDGQLNIIDKREPINYHFPRLKSYYMAILNT